MYPVKRLYNPFVRKNDSTRQVMTDVLIALLPCIVMTWVAYGFTPIVMILVSVGSAMTAEFLFNMLFSKDTSSLGDGSSIVTGVLLAFTIGPLTPLPIVAVGGATAVIFGKLLWGGLGRNRFNPALMGREFMSVLFPAVMSSAAIWKNADFFNIRKIVLFDNRFWDHLFFRPVGAIGEYAPLFLILGGLFLLWRRRISWHIPFAMLTAFTLMLLIFREHSIIFTLGGLLLGAIFMATDMPTSSSTSAGKIYFGAMIGIVAVICLMMGATRGYASYSILLLNAFVVPVNWVFRPRTWGKNLWLGTRIWQGALLTGGIIAAAFALMWVHHHGAMIYPIMAYAAYSILRFALSDEERPWGRLIKRIAVKKEKIEVH